MAFNPSFSPRIAPEVRAGSLPWLVAGLGLLALYGPTVWRLAHGVWATDQQGHGPIVFALAVWLIWRRWGEIQRQPDAPMPWLGWTLLVPALLLQAFGRSQDILLFEIGSAIPVLIAIVLLLKGPAGLRPITFALFFLLFLIPLPGVVVDTLTQPMKMGVSVVAEQLLHALGYPIARNGVTLQVGQYQLLVADACAGLNTLFALEALGLLYLNVFKHESLARNVALAVLIVPISFSANVVRVVTLCLVTYHLGDEAGQGFLHGFSGIVLFVVAIFLTVAVDSLIRLGLQWRRKGASA
jgi:exosortase B